MWSDLMLCTASGIFRTLEYSELCLIRYLQAYSIIFSSFKGYLRILKHYYDIQPSSAPCVTLIHSQPCHAPSPGIFAWTWNIFKTLWNFDQVYSELYHIKVYSGVIQAYSEPSVTLAFAETWHISNPGIFRTQS